MSALDEIVKKHLDDLRSEGEEEARIMHMLRDLVRKSARPVNMLTSLADGRVSFDLQIDDLEASSNLLAELQKTEREQQARISNAANKILSVISSLIKAVI
jgi:di/tripeptidase